MGSPAYMSPEQCLGQDVDSGTDIYAMGCVMYESITGRPPFEGDSHLEVLRKHILEMPKSPQEVCPNLELPNDLQQIIFKCLAKEREARFENITDLIGNLDAVNLATSRKRRRTDNKNFPLVWPGSLLFAGALVACKIAMSDSELERRAVWPLCGVTALAEFYWLYCIYRFKGMLIAAGYKPKCGPLLSSCLNALSLVIAIGSAAASNTIWLFLGQVGTAVVLTLLSMVAVAISLWTLVDFYDFLCERRGRGDSSHVLVVICGAATSFVLSGMMPVFYPVNSDSILTMGLTAYGIFSIAFGLLYLLRLEVQCCNQQVLLSDVLTGRKFFWITYTVGFLCVSVLWLTSQSQYHRLENKLLTCRDKTEAIGEKRVGVRVEREQSYCDRTNHRYPAAELSLGWSCLAMRQYSKALLAFDRSLAINSDNVPYAHLGKFIAGCLSGNTNVKAARLALTTAAKSLPDEWPRPALLFLAGKINRDSMFSRAKNESGYQTEAHFYSGIGYLLSKNYRSAAAEFNWVDEFGDKNYREYSVALAVGAQLED